MDQLLAILEPKKEPAMERRPELIDYINVLFRWWRFILAGTLLITTLAVLATFLITPEYTTQASVLVVKSKVAEEGKEPSHTPTSIESYISLLDNNTIYLRAMERFRLREKPYEMKLKHLQKSLKVRFLPKTDLLSVTFRFPDPELSQKIAQFVVEQAVEHNRELNRAEALESQEFLHKELELARARRDEIQARLLELRRDFDSGALEGLRNAALRNLGVIDELRRTVEAKVASGEAALVEGEARLAALPLKIERRSELSREATYQQTVARIADTSLAELLGVPFVVEEVSWAHASSAIEVVKIAMQLSGDRAELQRLTESLADLHTKAEQWNREYAMRRETIKDLSDQYQVANRVYEQIAMRYNEATVTVGSRSHDLRLVDAPFLPEQHSWPQRGLVALVVGQLSLVLLTLAAFLLDYVARRRSSSF
jgi:uncharacterized protein involved in exopolysaccharide biosynthesis